MAKFLSPQWIGEVVEGLKASGDVTGVDLTLQQIVGTSSGERRYWIRFSPGDIDGAPGDAPDGADVTFSQDEDTAVALSRGELVPQAAFMQGKLKITGNMGKLLKHQSAFQALGPAMSRIATDY